MTNFIVHEPMTAKELRDARIAIGRVIFGRMLSYEETAKLCNLHPSNGADTIRRWQNGKGDPTGPVSALLDIYCLIDEPQAMGEGAFFEAMVGIIKDRLGVRGHVV